MPAFVGDAAGETRGNSMEISGTAEISGTILPFPNVLHIPVRFGTPAHFLPSAGTYSGYHRSRRAPIVIVLRRVRPHNVFVLFSSRNGHDHDMHTSEMRHPRVTDTTMTSTRAKCDILE